MSRKSTRKAASKKPVRTSASAARAEGAQRTRRALDAARGEAIKAIAAADQENARKREERRASPDGMAPSERAVAQGGKAAKARDAKPAKERKARRTSALDAAAMVLAEAKEPMRARDLIERMAAKGLWTSPGGKTPEATLYAAMSREIKLKGAQARFTMSERGRFAVRASAS